MKPIQHASVPPPPRDEFADKHVKNAGGGQKTHRAVASYFCRENASPHGHECLTQCALAQRLAALKEVDYAGLHAVGEPHDGSMYMVPSDTLSVADASRLGIKCEHDLFGGVVPHFLASTKVITHDLPQPGMSAAPPHWSPRFPAAVRAAVLPGFTVFAVEDALAAGEILLRDGPVRLKKPSGIGGLGQSVAGDAQELRAQLREIDPARLAEEGLVLEHNLAEVETCSVGQVIIAGMVATYCGTQRLTRNNRGQDVYGGSSLLVAQGGFDALLSLPLEQHMHTAIEQARIYHAAALASFPGMFVSRSNYDIAQGRDAGGIFHSGVLEQSWRIGGASGAEIAALEAFAADPQLRAVRASTTEVYGDTPDLPRDALVYYQGVDEKIGPITKYSRIEPYADT